VVEGNFSFFFLPTAGPRVVIPFHQDMQKHCLSMRPPCLVADTIGIRCNLWALSPLRHCPLTCAGIVFSRPVTNFSRSESFERVGVGWLPFAPLPVLILFISPKVRPPRHATPPTPRLPNCPRPLSLSFSFCLALCPLGPGKTLLSKAPSFVFAWRGGFENIRGILNGGLQPHVSKNFFREPTVFPRFASFFGF